MFNCYSGEGGGGGRDQEWPPARHRNCIFPAPGQPVEQLCLHLELPLLFHRDSSLSLLRPSAPTISSILPRHTVHRLLFSRPPLAHVRFSPRWYQLIRPLRPSSTAVRSPLARRYFRPKLRFETLRKSTFSFRKDRAGRRVYVLRLSRFSFIGF